MIYSIDYKGEKESVYTNAFVYKVNGNMVTSGRSEKIIVERADLPYRYRKDYCSECFIDTFESESRFTGVVSIKLFHDYEKVLLRKSDNYKVHIDNKKRFDDEFTKEYLDEIKKIVDFSYVVTKNKKSDVFKISFNDCSRAECLFVIHCVRRLIYLCLQIGLKVCWEIHKDKLFPKMNLFDLLFVLDSFWYSSQYDNLLRPQKDINADFYLTKNLFYKGCLKYDYFLTNYMLSTVKAINAEDDLYYECNGYDYADVAIESRIEDNKLLENKYNLYNVHVTSDDVLDNEAKRLKPALIDYIKTIEKNYGY